MKKTFICQGCEKPKAPKDMYDFCVCNKCQKEAEKYEKKHKIS